ncbi:hypothetical protein AKJ09_08030 [Labilithrix luteola]|uniref:Big-1 domain-containing protein n=1 Tax=Labilithrix luteola TaxID=1391654 RepID=A0A0K1Q6U1_9BACT|nr:hypothetical protein [Labilithrix luteola]AKV01367.1 hypothetical protein AKJ09_08030 [Labilithrix luteola]
MRKSIFWLGSLATTLALFACQDDSSSNTPGTFDPDAGTYEPPAVDASKADVDTADAADAKPSVVTVTVTRGSGPAADVLVVFHDAAGAVLGTTKTDATGKATSSTTIPAQVSVLLGGAASGRLIHTWTGVEAGDDLVVKDPFPTTVEDRGAYGFHLFGSYEGADSYGVTVGPCGGSWPSQSIEAALLINAWENCLGTPTAVLASALLDYNISAPKAFAFKKDIGVPAAGPEALSVSLPDWQAPANATLTLTNRPADVGVAVSLGDIVGGVRFETARQWASEADTATLDYPAGFGDAHQFGAAFRKGTSSNVFLKRSAAATAASFDLATALPTIETLTFDTTDTKRPTLTWTASSSLASSDGGEGFIDFYDRHENTFGWSFVVAPGATSIRVPQFPAEAAAWLPFGEDGGEVPIGASPPSLAFVESDLHASYAEFRHDGATLIPYGARDFVTQIVLPKDGTIRLTSYNELAP